MILSPSGIPPPSISSNANEIREYTINFAGVSIGERLVGYEQLITGIPTRVGPPGPIPEKP